MRDRTIKCALQYGDTPDRIAIWKCWFLRREEYWSIQRKTSQSKDKNQQQTQPTHDAESGNRTRATSVRGKCSHHCAIPAPLKVLNVELDVESQPQFKLLLHLSPSFISVQFIHVFEISRTNTHNDDRHGQTRGFDDRSFSILHVCQHTISQEKQHIVLLLRQQQQNIAVRRFTISQVIRFLSYFELT